MTQSTSAALLKSVDYGNAVVRPRFVAGETVKRFSYMYLLLAASASAQAAGHIVIAGGSPPTFTPAAITIAAGDSVTFENGGGLHNVAADDGSFRCSHGCKGDAQGDTGAPNSSHWVVTLTFTQAGTVGYFCEIHGAPGQGMYGTINVQAPQPPPPSTSAIPLISAACAALLALALAGFAALRLRRS